MGTELPESHQVVESDYLVKSAPASQKIIRLLQGAGRVLSIQRALNDGGTPGGQVLSGHQNSAGH